MSYVLFRDDPSSHKEVYLVRLPRGGFTHVGDPNGTSLKFATAREAYDFGGQFQTLQWWRVGYR